MHAAEQHWRQPFIRGHEGLFTCVQASIEHFAQLVSRASMLLGHNVAGGRRSLRRDSRQEQALDLARMGDTQALVGIEARLQHAQQACSLLCSFATWCILCLSTRHMLLGVTALLALCLACTSQLQGGCCSMGHRLNAGKDSSLMTATCPHMLRVQALDPHQRAVQQALLGVRAQALELADQLNTRSSLPDGAAASRQVLSITAQANVVMPSRPF